MILWDEGLKVIIPLITSLYTTKIRKYSERTGCIIDVLQKDTLPERKPNSRKDKSPSCKLKSRDEEHLLDKIFKVPLRNVREVNLIIIVQLLSQVWFFLTPGIAACQALLSWSLLKFMCTELVMLSNHLVLSYLPEFAKIHVHWVSVVSNHLVVSYLLEFAKIHVHWVSVVSNHLVLCCPLLLLPSVFLSIRTFSNELALGFRWPKYWSFSISPSTDYLVLT